MRTFWVTVAHVTVYALAVHKVWEAVFIRVWLGRGLHPGTKGYAQTRGHARGARFWVVNEVSKR